MAGIHGIMHVHCLFIEDGGQVTYRLAGDSDFHRGSYFRLLILRFWSTVPSSLSSIPCFYGPTAGPVGLLPERGGGGVTGASTLLAA